MADDSATTAIIADYSVATTRLLILFIHPRLWRGFFVRGYNGRMATGHKTLVPFQLALLIVIFATGAYATGYLWLGSRTDWKSRASGQLQAIERSYGNPWLAKFFRPAGWAEQRVRGIEIDVRDEPLVKLMGS